MKTLNLLSVFVILMTTGCNSMYIKPGTLDKSQKIYADRGGYGMKRSVKERMQDRGYNVVVGKNISSKSIDGDSSIELDESTTMDARYVVKVAERKESFFVPWCIFNGFWWWNFNMSIADQKTGDEILSWRGRGCANSSLDKLDKMLDKLEGK
jgi:hypothetical protein